MKTALPAKDRRQIVPFNGAGLLCSQRPLEPHTANIQSCVEAVLYALFYNAVLGADRRVGELKLNGDLRRNVRIALLFRFQDLKHDDVGICHGAVIHDGIITKL